MNNKIAPMFNDSSLHYNCADSNVTSAKFLQLQASYDLMLQQDQERKNMSNPTQSNKNILCINSLNTYITKFCDALKNNDVSTITTMINNDKNELYDDISYLRCAIIYNNNDAISQILSKDEPIQDKLVFMYACKQSNFELVRKLALRDDIDVNIHEYNETSPLFYAIYTNNNQLLYILLNNEKTDLYQVDVDSNDILYTLCKLGSNELITELFKVSSFDIKKMSMHPNEYFNYSAQNILINDNTLTLFYKFIDLNCQNLYGYTPLIHLYTNSRFDIIIDLFNNLTNIDLSITDKLNMNLLMYAVETSNSDFIEILLNYLRKYSPTKIKTVMNQKNHEGYTPLLLASKINNDAVLLSLLSSDLQVDINLADVDGETCLFYVIKNKNNVLFNYLMKRSDLNINHKNNNGLTPLMYAIETGNNMGLEPALRKGLPLQLHPRVLLNSISHNNITNPSNPPKFCAELLNHVKINVNLLDNNGDSALMLAINKKASISEATVSSASVVGADNTFSNMASLAPLDSFGMSLMPNIPVVPNYDILINMLLDNPTIDLNLFNKKGHNLLMHVCDKNYVALFNDILCRPTIDINRQNNKGINCLMYLLGLMTNNSSTSPSYKQDCVPFSEYTRMSSPVKVPDNKLHMFKLLIKKSNINVNLQDRYGYNVLMMITKNNLENVLDDILSLSSCNIDMQNWQGVTALMYAVQNKSWDNVIALISKNANQTFTDYKEENVLSYASKSNSLAEYRYIITLANNQCLEDVVEGISESTQKKSSWKLF
jgi:ankyrin repeat protein